MRLFILLFFSACLISCRSRELPFIHASNAHVELQLGESPFYLKIPPNYRLEEARGKEGQLGYNILPKDSTSSIDGFVEIEPGRPHGGRYMGDNPKSYVRTVLLGKNTTWKMEQTESGYFNAYARQGDVRVEARSKDQKEMDSLIAIIASLRKK